MKILVLTRYDVLGASSRLRFFQYADFLQRNGWSIDVFPLFDNDYLERFYATGEKRISKILTCYLKRFFILFKAKQFDLLWIEKELFPMFPATIEKLFNAVKIPYIVDYDDAIFHNYDMNKIPIVSKFLNSKIDAVMNNASIVMAGNKYLAERANKAVASRVELIPTVVDADKYKPCYEPNDRFTIGWIGSPATEKYLQMIVQVLGDLKEKIDFQFIVVGAKNFDAPEIDYQVHSWSEDSEADEIKSFDVGVMPLPDEPWERGKCGYKLIQYMACGKPVIASPVGVNKEIVEPGINGFLAKTTDEWLRYLLKLYQEPELRVVMGKNNRRKVEQEYSREKTAPKIKKLLEAIYKETKKKAN
jgi:glycosyltransferase involved in cell wall biosynthesis